MSVISSDSEAQTPLLIVHRRTACDPAASVTTTVGELISAGGIDGVPLTILQVPVVPAAAVLAAIVKVALLHCVISVPADAAFGFASTSMVMPALVVLQPAAVVTITDTTSSCAKELVVNIFEPPS